MHNHRKHARETEALEEDREGAPADGGEEPKKILPRKSRSAFLAALRRVPWEDSREPVFTSTAMDPFIYLSTDFALIRNPR